MQIIKCLLILCLIHLLCPESTISNWIHKGSNIPFGISFVRAQRVRRVNVPLGALITAGVHGSSHQMAMEIAVEALNALPPLTPEQSLFKIQPVFSLKIRNTTGPQNAVQQASDLITVDQVVGIVGPVYSSESLPISYQVATPMKKPIVSYGATSGALGNMTEHPYFMRTVPANQHISEALVDLMYLMEWSNIVVIASNESYGVDGAQHIRELAQFKQVKIAEVNMVGSEDDIFRTLQILRSRGPTTVVVFIAQFQLLNYLIHNVNAMNMTKEKYVWLFSETYSDLFHMNSFSAIEPYDTSLLGKVDRLLYARIGTSFWVKQKFLLDKWMERTGHYNINHLDPFAYDAIMCIGHAARSLLTNKLNVNDGEILQAAIQRLDFLGASGRVKFSSLGKDAERIGSTVYISNMLDVNGEINTLNIVSWDMENSLSILRDAFGQSYVFLPGEAEPINLASSERTLHSTISATNQWKTLPRNNNPPPKRHSFCSAVHSSNDEMVLFGGSTLYDILSDFWRFSFKTQLWTQIFPLSDRPRGRKDATCFIIDDEFYLYGGFDNNRFFDDVWRFSFTTYQWTEVKFVDEIPTPRRSARAAVSAKVAYIFGGESILGNMNDVWKLETNKLTLIQPNASSTEPVGLRDHCVEVYNHTLIVFGGRSTDYPGGSNELWFFNLDTLTWTQKTQIKPPQARYSLVCSIIRNELWVGLGWNSVSEGVQLNDFRVVNIDESSSVQTWRTISSNLGYYGHDGRDSSVALFYENYLLWTAGWATDTIRNDFWRIDTYAKRVEQIHNDKLSPPGMAKHTTVMIGNNAVQFGGINSLSVPIAHIYQFNVDSEIWSSVEPTGTGPRARHDHAACSIGDQMFVFGGYNSASDEYFGDFWAWSSVLNSWREIVVDDPKPGPRAFHSMQSINDGQNIILYGGVNRNTFLQEVWMYDVFEETWSEKTTNSTILPEVFGVRSTVLNNTFVIGMGASSSLAPDSSLYTISGVADNSMNIQQYSNIVDFTKTLGTISGISHDTIFMFGGNIYGELSNELVRISPNGTEVVDVSSSFNTPYRRDQHTSVFHGDRLMIFGGVGPITNRLYRNSENIGHDVWVFRLGPTCAVDSGLNLCHACGVGTYQYRAQCLSCPSGYYNNRVGQNSCTACPKGFFNTIEGASSIDFCYPCPEGSYNDIEGQKSCKPCNKTEFCPIGSQLPLSFDYYYNTTSEVKSKHPQPHENTPIRNRNLNVIALAIAGLVAIVLFILYVITRKKLDKYFTGVDFLFDDMHNILQGPMYRKKNSFGGFASIVAFFFVIAIIISTLVPAITDNIVESRSLIPNLALKQQVRTSFTATVNLMDYRGACSRSNSSLCALKIRAYTTGLSLQNRMYSCQEHADYSLLTNQRNCTITFDCLGCSFDNTDKASLKFDIVEPNAYANGYQWSFTSMSSYPKQNSSVSGVVLSSNSTFYRGISQPTTVELNAIQSSYRRSDVKATTKNAGWFLDYSSYTRGEETDWRGFNHKNGVSFKFDIARSASSLEVIQQQRRDFTEVISALLGGIAGLLGLIGKVMQKLELISKRGLSVLWRLYDKKNEKKMRNGNISGDLSVPLNDELDDISEDDLETVDVISEAAPRRTPFARMRS